MNVYCIDCCPACQVSHDSIITEQYIDVQLYKLHV